MSNQLLPQTLISSIANTGDSELEEGEEEEEEDDLEKLEAEVKEMAQRILEYRTTMPEHFKSALASTLTARRPLMPNPPLQISAAEPSSDGGPAEEGNEEGGLVEEDKEILEKVELVKRKKSKNMSSMPVVMKRMKECISRIDNLEETRPCFIHPAFRKKQK